MKKEELIKRLQESLPEFNFRVHRFSEEGYTNISCARFNIDNDIFDFSGRVKQRMADYIEKNNLAKDIDKFKRKLGLVELADNDYNDHSILLSDIDEEFLGLLIKGLKGWKEWLDEFRKGESNRDQLIIIHPDWDLEDFEKDFKIISGEEGDYRLGIISTDKWDFSNEELRDELQVYSGDCFCIWSIEDEDMSLQEIIEDRELEDAYRQIKYPNLKSITEIYSTDFD